MRKWKALATSLAAAAVCACVGTGPEKRSAPDDPPPIVELRQIVASGEIPGLRQPKLVDVQTEISSIYEQNAFRPLWLSAGRLTPKGQAILDALRLSAGKGLNPSEYDVPLLTEWVRGLPAANASRAAMLDAALTVELMRFAAALHQGRVDPHQVHFAIRPKDRLDPGSFVRGYILSDQSLSDSLTQVEPPFRAYKKTVVTLARYLQLAAQEPRQMPAQPKLPLRRGQRYPDLPALAARLELLGDLTPPPAGWLDSRVFDGPVPEAVGRFQARHGIAATGTIDLQTWKALTTPLSQRVEQLSLTLERWRWMPSAVRPAIVVNIPEFELRAFDDKRELALRMHVIVGKAYRHKTPVFEDSLESVIVRPFWNIPLSIQRGEMVPKIRKDPGYLSQNNIQIVDRNNQAIAWDPEQPPINRIASGEVHLRQMPGPENSLGLLKFDFPNDYSVYMHGTPVRQLFSQARRDFSHGCIRVEDPESLAAWVLRDNPDWNREQISATCQGDRTIRIPLHQPIAVLVLYATAIVEDNGEVHFYNDIYGYDAELRKALAAKAAPSRL